jgi:hypothetical protein
MSVETDNLMVFLMQHGSKQHAKTFDALRERAETAEAELADERSALRIYVREFKKMKAERDGLRYEKEENARIRGKDAAEKLG